MPLPREHTYTIKDIYALPEGERAELINGQIYMMGAPTYLHQALSMELSATIRDYIRSRKGSCQVLQAPLAVTLFADDQTYVEPDVTVICDKSKITEKGINGAPDFIIEIVSPGSRRMDYTKKTALYADAGVREYWIVDPDKERTTLYRYEEDAAPMIAPFDQTLTVGIYGDFEINIAKLLKEAGIK